MDDIVPYDPRTIIKYDKCKSESINDLSNLMENKEFRSFYDKYLTNWDDIKSVTMFMKVYENFELLVKPYLTNISQKEKKQILAMMTEKAIKNSYYRQNICQQMTEFMEGKKDKISFLDFKLYLEN